MGFWEAPGGGTELKDSPDRFPVGEVLSEMSEIGACGDWCRKCPHFGKTCRGCGVEKLSTCKFLRCLAQRGIEHCGLCSEFPCEDLLDFVPDDRLPKGFHIESLRLRVRLGTEQWLAHVSREWAYLVPPKGEGMPPCPGM